MNSDRKGATDAKLNPRHCEERSDPAIQDFQWRLCGSKSDLDYSAAAATWVGSALVCRPR